MMQAPEACDMNNYGLVIYRFHNKLVCLVSKLVCCVTSNRKDTSLLQKQAISRKLRVRKVL